MVIKLLEAILQATPCQLVFGREIRFTIFPLEQKEIKYKNENSKSSLYPIKKKTRTRD
jgi:hypothetical protein